MYSPWRHLGSVLRKRGPIQLTFFVTRKCNARCPFCFYLNASAPPPRDEPELTLAEIERIAGSLGPLLWLAFSGGEPFLRPDIADISRVFYQRNRPAIILLPSNGLLPQLIRSRTEQILRECPQSTVVVKLSLDGIGADHDALRGTPGGFERVLQTCRALAPLLDAHPNFELGINSVMLRDNQHRIEDLIDFVATLAPVSTHTVSLVRGPLREGAYKDVDPGRYAQVAEVLARRLQGGAAGHYRFRGARLKAAQDILQRRLIQRTLVEQRRLMACYAGRLNLVLTETGAVYPCELLDARMGHVREHGCDMQRLLASAAARAVQQQVRDGPCHCTHECNFITNILFNPRLYPALAGQYLDLLRRPRQAHAGTPQPAPAR